MKISIIVGRFQSSCLTKGHEMLSEYALNDGDRLIIFLGVASTRSTYHNPLSFGMRRKMILDFILPKNINHKEILILPIKDLGNIKMWNDSLDNKISDLLYGDEDVVTLYGGRDSFIHTYNGKYRKVDLTKYINCDSSSTKMRDLISNCTSLSNFNFSFREGVIWQTGNCFPQVLATVDIAIVDKLTHRILMARKPTDDLWRFIGGFSDVDDESYEAAAMREIKEETGLMVGGVKYIGSCKIDDNRFKKEKNKIKTLFFLAEYCGGEPIANDDIKEVKWFTYESLEEYNVIPCHRHLLRMLKYRLGIDI